MPKNGRPLRRTASSSASSMPDTAARPRRQSAKAPTPGSTMRSALRTSSASPDTLIAVAMPASLAARSNALAAERTLPEPSSTMTVVTKGPCLLSPWRRGIYWIRRSSPHAAAERAFRRGNLASAPDIDFDRLAQRARQALEAGFDDVVVVLAVEILDVQGHPG